MRRFNWRTQWDDEAAAEARAATDIICKDPSLTDTSKQADADLNNVIIRFGITDGALRPQATDPRFFGDFSEATDFRGVLDATRTAVEHFNGLPADIRARFQNDPAYLHDWVNDTSNAEEAVKLGLLAKKPPYIPETVRERADVQEWASRPENATEATRLGLIQPTPPPVAPVSK